MSAHHAATAERYTIAHEASGVWGRADTAAEAVRLYDEAWDCLMGGLVSGPRLHLLDGDRSLSAEEIDEMRADAETEEAS
jgi:hypothetical protein